jgi:hypothetical protein
VIASLIDLHPPLHISQKASSRLPTTWATRSRGLEPTDKIDCSNRSQQRYIMEKAKDVTDALCQIVFPAIDLDRPDAGTQYRHTAFLDLQSYLGLTGTVANQGSQMFGEETAREAGGPAGDTHL